MWFFFMKESFDLLHLANRYKRQIVTNILLFENVQFGKFHSLFVHYINPVIFLQWNSVHMSTKSITVHTQSADFLEISPTLLKLGFHCVLFGYHATPFKKLFT